LRNERRNWILCPWRTGLHIHDSDHWVEPTSFLNRSAVRLHELTEVMDVSQLRGMNVCCALVPHKVKKGCEWWMEDLWWNGFA
jgi:hypothetical protein